jgi:hypothetical protein
MEKALRYELEQHITGLTGNIYPTHAPSTYTKPYLVYTRINTSKVKTLEGYHGKQSLSYMFSVMATKYADMKSLSEKVEALLISLPHTTIGTGNIYVEDLTINNISETWENELGVNRGNIDFTISF